MPERNQTFSVGDGQMGTASEVINFTQHHEQQRIHDTLGHINSAFLCTSSLLSSFFFLIFTLGATVLHMLHLEGDHGPDHPQQSQDQPHMAG